jgi:phage terminase small subunit
MVQVGEQVEKGGRRLQPQQQKFLDNYIHGDMTQTAAARAAGYANPNVRAVQLLNNPVVRERMEEMRNELQAKYGVTIAKSIRDLQIIRDRALSEGHYSAAIKAEETRLKASGVMVDQKHVTYQNVDNMDRDKIVEQLNHFIERAQSRMIDVTPAESPTEPEQVTVTCDSKQAAG